MGVTITSKVPKAPMRPIIGLDMSTKTGVAVYRPDSNELTLSTMYFEKQTPRDDLHQFARWQQYEDALQALLFLINPIPGLVVVEGYGFASQSLGTLVEVGTHLKRVVYRADIPMLIVSPNALKKFVTGKGAGDKNVMMLEAYKRFGIDTKDDNQVDAACLAYMGAYHLGHSPVPLPAANLAALTGLGVKPVKKPKKGRKTAD